MTKENEKIDSEQLVEKTEWQLRHEEFIARQEAKKIEDNNGAAEEETQKEDDMTDAKEESETSENLSDENQSSTSEEIDLEENASDETEDKLSGEESDQTDERDTAKEPIESKKDEGSENLEEAKLRKKEIKAQAKAEKKAKALERRLESRPMNIARLKVASIILIALLTLIFSSFILSPYSKEKQFEVVGLKNADEASILVSTGIKKSDYITTVFLKKKSYEKAILEANPWVKKVNMTYHFPNVFKISVTENRIIAYAHTKSGYHPVIETGLRMPLVSESQLPERFLTVNLTDEKAVQSLVTQLAKLDEALISSIQVVNPISNAATKDLILIEVKEGHKIRVPLSQIDIKLPYYKKIVDSLTEPSIIDMEVGVYTTTETIEAIMAQEKEERDEAKKIEDKEDKKTDKTLEEANELDENSQEDSTLSEESEVTEMTESIVDETIPEVSTENSSQ